MKKVGFMIDECFAKVPSNRGKRITIQRTGLTNGWI